MSNTKRPSLERKQTRASKAKRKAALDFGVKVTVDGEDYVVRQGDLTSLDTMELRRSTGYSFRGLAIAMQKDPDIDLLAALVWLSRRINGEPMLDYAEVASEIGYDVDADVDLVEEPEDEAEKV